MEEKNLIVEEFKTALLQIDRIKAAEIFKKTYQKDQNFEELEDLTVEALEKIGDGWEEGKFSLSQVYMSGIICEELIEKYIPEDKFSDENRMKIAIGVLQDHHGLGKRIIHSVLKAGGYEVIDFGQGLSVEEIVEKTLKREIDILMISTLMLPSALKVKEVVENLRSRGSSVKIIVGGAPFRLDSSLWQQVNADADGKNGVKALKIIEKYMRGEE
ncbi:MAG: cobalamin B12-binding domain-containing protein [Bacillota bacterium]